MAFQTDAFQNDAFQIEGGGGGETISLALIDQTAATFAPTVTPGGVTIALGLIDRTAVAFEPFIGAQQIFPDLIDQTAATFSPTVSSVATISLGLIDRTAVVFAPSAGGVVAPNFINQTAATFAPTIGFENEILLGLIDRHGVAYAPSIIDVGGNGGGDQSLQLLYDGNDIIDDVVIASAQFTSQVNGQPGTCQFRVKDPLSTYSFTVGKPLLLRHGGTNVWRGYVANVRRVYAFDAENTSNPITRLFLIDGFDINILFTKRIVFRKSNPIDLIGPLYRTNNTQDIEAIDDLVTSFLDLSGDNIDVETLVENIGYINIDHPAAPIQPSMNWANTMRGITALTNAIYYIDPDARFVHTDVDTPNAEWELSDVPDGVSSIGYREMEIIHDGTGLINDALIWGIALGGNQVVIARDEDATSIATHGRWQFGELNGGMYKQATVNRRAASIVDGSPLSKRGAKNDKVSVACTVFEPGFRVAQKVDFTSEVFGFTDVIPIRRMDVTFVSKTTLRYRLFLSHEIDMPWNFFDNYYYRFPFPDFPIIDPTIPDFPDPGTAECDCGTTDSFDRTEASGWGVSDAGQTWAIVSADPNMPITASGSISLGTARLIADTPAGPATGSPLAKAGMGNFQLEPLAAEIHYRFKVDDMSGGNGIGVLLQTDPLPANANFGHSLSTNWMMLLFHRIQIGINTGKMGWFIQGRRSGVTSSNTGVVDNSVDANPNTWYDVKVILIPSVISSTLLAPKFKLWPSDDVEPATWFEYTGSNGLINDVGPVQHFGLMNNGTPGLVRTADFAQLAIVGLDRCQMKQFEQFDRVVFPGPGWGTSTFGNPWTLVTSTGNVRVDAGEGFVIQNSGQGATLRITPPMTGSFEMTSQLRHSVIPGSGNHLDTTFDLGNGKKVKFIVSSSSGTGLIELGSANLVSVAKIDWTTAGFNWRMTWDELTGALKFRLWGLTAAEPSTWLLETTESGAIGNMDVVFANVGAGGSRETRINFIEFYYDDRPCYFDPITGDPVGPVVDDGPPNEGLYCELITHSGGTLFSTSKAYVTNSLQVWVNGGLVTDLTPNPSAGLFTTTQTVGALDILYVCYQANGDPV